MRLLTFVALLAWGCSSAPIPTTAPSQAPTLTPSPTSAPSPPPKATLPPAIAFSDGTWRVPQDIKPGTYRTVEFTTDCYWTRLRGFDSGLDDLIASNIGSGYQLVAIAPRDAGFDSVSCGDWTIDLRRVTDSLTEFDEGTYLVGTDVLPGTYRAAQGESCSWLRLSGLGFTRSDILERALVASGDPPVVEILPTDAGFSSSGCGTWTTV